jgi:predicted transcriptional regulator
LIAQLTEENETLYQQFNHLMIRNNKLLKRIDDQQRLIDDLHVRIEELQLISNNQLRLNDRLRSGLSPVHPLSAATPARYADMETMFNNWKSFPGQTGQNTPNLRKQVLLLATLYREGALSAARLFAACDIGGVTGARYVSVLKKAGLVKYTGARKKGVYELTAAGLRFVEKSNPDDAQVLPSVKRSTPASIGVESVEDL